MSHRHWPLRPSITLLRRNARTRLNSRPSLATACWIGVWHFVNPTLEPHCTSRHHPVEPPFKNYSRRPSSLSFYILFYVWCLFLLSIQNRLRAAPRPKACWTSEGCVPSLRTAPFPRRFPLCKPKGREIFYRKIVSQYCITGPPFLSISLRTGDLRKL